MSVSWGGIIGGVVGGIIGYFVGGGWYGAFVGASIGYSIGSAVDPVKADVKTPGVPVQPFQVTSNEVGSVLPDVLGTAKVTGHLLSYGDETVEAIREGGGGGKGGSGGKGTISGYRYHASWVLGICLGPVDCLYTVFKDEKVVWDGEENRPATGGQKSIVIEGFGTMHFFYGTDDQVHNDDVGDLIGHDDLNSPMRGLCWAFFHDCYLGDFNRLPTMTFVLRRTPTISFSANQLVRLNDYNAAHAAWYILEKMTGLPATWLHTADFAAAALTLGPTEERGISMLFDQQAAAITFLEAINSHVDMILRYGNDGKFHPKLIRDDYNLNALPVIDESVLLDKPNFTRKSWIDTINELVVEYSLIKRDIYPGEFYPWCMCTDGAYLYIAGQSILDGKYYARIEKRSMLGQLLDQVDVLFGTGTLPVWWNQILVDDDSIYLAGCGERTVAPTGWLNGVVERRKKGKLNDTTWKYEFDLGGPSHYKALDIVQEPGGDVIWTGNDSPGNLTTYGGRLRHGDGSEVWYFARGGDFLPGDDRNGGLSVAIASDGLEAYFCKYRGYIETVRVSDGSRIGDVAHGNRCWKRAKIWPNAELADYLFVAGCTWPEVLPYEVGASAVVTKNGLWEEFYGPVVPVTEANIWEGIACDDFNVYVVGRVPYSISKMRIAKYDMVTGLELWAIDGTLTNRCAVAICVYGQYVYVSGWDASLTNRFWLERRSIYDGLLI